jgi:hypothetical protein
MIREVGWDGTEIVHSLLCRPRRTGFDDGVVSLCLDRDSDMDPLTRLRRQQQNTMDSAAEMRESHLRELWGRSTA